jgi:WD40 repeat protein
MRKIILLVLVCGYSISACGNFNDPVPAATVFLSPTSAPTPSRPALIKEIDLETRTGTSYTLDWSHDGEILAVGSGYEITLLSQNLSETLNVLRPEPGALGVSWSPDGNRFATIFGYRNPTIRIWDWDGEQLSQAHLIQAGSDQYGVSWSPDGELLATLGDDDKTTIQIWDTSTWEEIQKYELPYRYPRRALNWSADSVTLYDAGESNGRAVVFALHVLDGAVQELATFPVAEVSAFVISPGAEYFAVADESGLMQIVDTSSGEVVTEMETLGQPVDLAWHPAGLSLAILGYKTELQLWSIPP